MPSLHSDLNLDGSSDLDLGGMKWSLKKKGNEEILNCEELDVLSSGFSVTLKSYPYSDPVPLKNA
jgi:hypothetical protein